MSISIYDIAKKAQVSPSTVSRALQDHPRIGAKTKARIQQLAREMGYIPSAVAKSLSDKKTWTIGIVIPSVADPFMADIVDGVEGVAQEAGYSIFLSNSRRNSKREMIAVETLHRRRVDAIVTVASTLGDRFNQDLEQFNIPIVHVGIQQNGSFQHTISENSFAGAMEATNHLLNFGHRRIGYIGALNRPESNRERLLGYKQALADSGLTISQELICLPEGQDDFERGKIGLAAILPHGATAVFCYNDRIAIGLMKACEEYNVPIPEQLSVVGFDDIRLAPYLRPALTTVQQPAAQMGQLAMQMILKLLESEAVENKRLDCRLIIRQSTANIETIEN